MTLGSFIIAAIALVLGLTSKDEVSLAMTETDCLREDVGEMREAVSGGIEEEPGTIVEREDCAFGTSVAMT